MSCSHKIRLIILGLGLFMTSASAQEFYSDDVHEVRLLFAEANWDHLLDSMYAAGDKDRLEADAIVDGQFMSGVGVRYKGFSSVSVDRVKNPFNIKLDYTINNQNIDGYEKIKLSNVIQDPSFIREVLSYEIARKYMPASQANFVKLYINDVYWGLYTNVEAVSKDFALKHFESGGNAFFKCNPEALDFDGDNSNLGDSYGTSPTDYEPYYDMESSTGWEDLYGLITTLNQDIANIEVVLNVDRTLWMHAFNYSLVNLDSYIGYAQNYYVYQDASGQFNPILWDLNMSFASFRFTDASDFYDGLSIEQTKTIDPLAHLNSFSVYERPLMRNLFENERYRKMYLAHIRTIVEENFNNQWYFTRGAEWQSIIDTCVAADTNKFYGYDNFVDNLTATVSDLIDYPGITDLIDARATYLNTYPGMNDAPLLSNAGNVPTDLVIDEAMAFTVSVTQADEVFLSYRFENVGRFNVVEMFDDGQHQDGTANDNVYGVELANMSNKVEYYFYADNATAGRFMPERAAYEFYELEAPLNVGHLVINEIQASNLGTIADPSGEFADWIELFNPGQVAVSTAGLYLSDDPLMKTKWALPEVLIEPNSYKLIWADNDVLEEGLHANFGLSSTNGEGVYLSYADTFTIDSVIFGPQLTDDAYARNPNGTGPFTTQVPTPGANNDWLSIEKPVRESFSMYPNPASKGFWITSGKEDVIEIIDARGQLIETVSLVNGKSRIEAKWCAGIYTVRSINNNYSKKLIIQ